MMKKMTLAELNKKYRIRDLADILLHKMKISDTEYGCMMITQKFIDVHSDGKNIDECITVEYSEYKREYIVKDDRRIRYYDWFDFLPYYVCFDCDEALAFAVVLLYMNEVRADLEDVRDGFKELIKQSCRNEYRYNRENWIIRE